MDSEQILLTMFKQQHYDATRHKMQKVIMTLSTLACAAGAAVMSIFYSGMIDIYVFAGAVVFSGITMLFVRLKILSLNIASFCFMIYVCFILVPVFWYFTGITGSAPYVSIIILVAILSMFTGKMLKWIFVFYFAVLIALTIYSAIVEIPAASDLPPLIYTIVAYVITTALTSYYILSKQNEYERMNDKFLRSSFKDELTRVFNRRVLDIIMIYEEALYQKEKSDYILFMFDIDKFKQMNDEHGHVFGDIVLRNIAKCINEKVRSSDFVVRYGGDEFLVVQTNASKESAKYFIERIENAMETSCYLDIDVTVSYGFALRSECDTPHDVLVLADRRLYEKKEAQPKE